MDSLRHHRDYLEDEWRGLRAAPLSVRKAMLVAMLVDGLVDRIFAEDAEADDILAYRAGLAAASPALGLILTLASRRAELVTEAVAVPLAGYGGLSVEDFMVSLYNDHSVQRLRLIAPDGERHDMLDALDAAIAALDRRLAAILNNPTS